MAQQPTIVKATPGNQLEFVNEPADCQTFMIDNVGPMSFNEFMVKLCFFEKIPGRIGGGVGRFVLNVAIPRTEAIELARRINEANELVKKVESENKSRN